jgi:hypothetical protein
MNSIHLTVIGNIISFVAAVFLFAGGWTRDRDRTFIFQIIESLLLCLANICFMSYAGITTLLLAAARNYLVLKYRYTKKTMWVFIVLTAAAGLAVNNIGISGLFGIAATVELALVNYHARTLWGQKAGLLVNTALWLLYDIRVTDISSAIAQAIMCVLTVVAMLRLHRIGNHGSAA